MLGLGPAEVRQCIHMQRQLGNVAMESDETAFISREPWLNVDAVSALVSAEDCQLVHASVAAQLRVLATVVRHAMSGQPGLISMAMHVFQT